MESLAHTGRAKAPKHLYNRVTGTGLKPVKPSDRTPGDRFCSVQVFFSSADERYNIPASHLWLGGESWVLRWIANTLL
ncbi:YycH family protein [Anopheles sinensis]|uniref:YycH family protein n=1 Tax=Anopheles sinensis TaxID=74873 RepID=A0A084W8V4_ANOSI|nr:YycH family protein [Anopheles sinensis]